jgi:hypothetical protein
MDDDDNQWAEGNDENGAYDLSWSRERNQHTDLGQTCIWNIGFGREFVCLSWGCARQGKADCEDNPRDP